jgi:hypothetical protein
LFATTTREGLPVKVKMQEKTASYNNIIFYTGYKDNRQGQKFNGHVLNSVKIEEEALKASSLLFKIGE